MNAMAGDGIGFFVAKVLSQAEYEGVALSDAERSMLRWSEVEPGAVADAEVAEQLASEMSDDEYEAKVSGLLARALEREASADQGALEAYKQAYAQLRTRDYYLGVMVAQGIGRRLRPWWKSLFQ